MKTRSLLAAGLCLIGVGSVSGEALRITTTPSHTATPTATPTPTATFGPTVVATPKPTPWPVQGDEFAVASSPDGDQSEPVVAISADDSFVVAWTDSGHDGSGLGVYARRFDKSGAPIGDQFLVNTTTTGDQLHPQIESDFDGNFVVVWNADDGGGGHDVMARMFDLTGSPLGPEFPVDPGTTAAQTFPDVSVAPEGDFVVVWRSIPGPSDTDYAIVGRRFLPDGSPAGDPFQVNTTTSGEQRDPAITMDAAGGFVVVWTGPSEPGQGNALFGQLYDDQAGPVGDEFLVSSSTSGNRDNPDAAWWDSAPGFVVTFETDLPGPGWHIDGRMFQASGAPLGDDFRISAQPSKAQRFPRVFGGPITTIGKPATFIVTWQDFGRDDPGQLQNGVFAQRFSNAPFPTTAFFLAAPPRQGSEYQINQYTPGNQALPALAIDRRGQFVIAWQSESQDGTGDSIFARRFGFPEARLLNVDEVPSSGPSNVNGVLEPGETVVVDPTWFNSSFSGLPLDGTTGNMTGPDGPTYTILNDSASYGDISSQEAATCQAATGDCYQVSVSSVRPVQHWDATLDETLTSTGPLLGTGPPPRSKTWALHVGGSFDDVPPDSFYPFIENVFHNRVTAGGGCGPGNFCGEEPVLRQQMAVFLLKSVYGAGFLPPAATGTMFDDVPAGSPFAPWIEELAREGITAGCTAPPPPALPSYCPTAPVTRQQMAVFLLKTRFGKDYTPPPCLGIFEDVPCGPGFPPFIENLYSRGITGGCQAAPLLYCPTESTKRKQMAVFLVRNFPLALYGAD